MKAEFDEHGTLKVFAEDHTEAFAIKEWWKKFNDSENRPAFGVDTDRYKNVHCIGVRK